ncbi:MAG: glycosyltransferase family 4 protein [Anaerolineae bacterium]|nr:glycosyltransferase family 4 protein [Anaerolineae bacterium]
MRLLHVTHQYPPAIGGSERYIADLSEELVARNHQVDVFTSRSVDFHTWRNELSGFERRNGVNVYRFSSMRRRGYIWTMLHFGLRNYWRTKSRRYEPFIFFGGGPISPGMYWRMRRQARRYDLVHLNCLVYSHVAYGYAAARKQNVPIVVTPHLHIDQPQTYAIGFMLQVLNRADHIIAVTEAERQHLISLGLNANRITTAGNGIRPVDFPVLERDKSRHILDIPQDAQVLLFFGRKEEYKGIGKLMEAYAALKPTHPSLFLLTMGPETEYSRKLARQYKNLPDWINYGLVSDLERAQGFSAADALVLPSKGEAFGIVFLEAWMTGTAVIGPRNPAVATIVGDGQDGLLVDPNDVQELAEAIKRLVHNPSLAGKMGELGHQKVLARYTVPRITDIVEGVYLRTLRQRQREQVYQR